MPSFNTARKRSKTFALAFGEFFLEESPDLARESNGDFDRIVGRPLKEDDNLKRN